MRPQPDPFSISRPEAEGLRTRGWFLPGPIEGPSAERPRRTVKLMGEFLDEVLLGLLVQD
jgi:hypothetical protein